MTKEGPDVVDWVGPGGNLASAVIDRSERSLNVYKADPSRVKEDAGQEEDLATGGYGRRQVFELVQNGVDAMIDDPGGRIEVRLTRDALYCANEGEPLQESGLDALMHAHISPKLGSEIGRFGLGFKSVLGVTRNPHFYSRSASFVFDAERSSGEIEEAAGHFDQYPVLRVAYPVNPREQAAADPVLGEMMEWATTIVKLPLDRDADWLTSDLDEFPREFLLFSPHIGQLDLSNQVSGTSRSVMLRSHEDTVWLGDGMSEDRWRIFSTTHRPSDRAKDLAGKLAAREELPIQWAVPLDGPAVTGQFWAFFPLRDTTTLSGIVNAPWQVNDDRTGLLETSLLNEELLEVLTELIVDHIDLYMDPDDPGRALELLPARGRESRSWGDGIISESVYDLLRKEPCIPTIGGSLRTITDVKVPDQPGTNPDRQLLELWGTGSAVQADWIHPSAIWSTNRRSRVDRLMKLESVRPRQITDWLESVVAMSDSDDEVDETDRVETSGLALRMIDRLVGEDIAENTMARIRRSRVLLKANSEFAVVDSNTVFLPGEGGTAGNELQTIHPDIATGLTTRPILERLGFQPGRPEDELAELLRQVGYRERAADWTDIWKRTRAIDDPLDVLTLFQQSPIGTADIRVKVVSGQWKHPRSVLMDGPVANGNRDPDVAIDRRFHSEDLDVLRALGIHDRPTAGFPFASDGPRSEKYRAECYRRYIREVQIGNVKPSGAKMDFRETTITGPLSPSDALTDPGRAALCESLLEANADFPDWIFRHETVDTYPLYPVEHPVLRFLRTEGWFETSFGPRPIEQCLGPGFNPWRKLLPVVGDLHGHQRVLGIPESLEDLSQQRDVRSRWDLICSELSGSNDDLAIGSFYAAACRAGLPNPPDGLRARVGDDHRMLEASSVVVCDEVSFRELRDRGEAAVCVPDPEARHLLQRRWGVKPSETIVRREPLAIESGTPEPLADYFPLLRSELKDAGLIDYDVVPCNELAWEFTTTDGTRNTSESFIVADDAKRIMWLSDDGPEGLLDALTERFDIDLRPDDAVRIIKQRTTQETAAHLKSLRSLSSDADRLLEAVGTDALRRVLPSGLLEAVSELGGSVSDRGLAELVLAVHGYSALQELRDDLDQAGFMVPAQWSGSSAARKFVRDLGFDESYAGFRGHSREPEELVPGPSDLPDEHHYQREIIDSIHGLLNGTDEHKRAVLSLPTGAGKTRIAVQALVERMATQILGSPIIWIAQSDELCEQAVQSWSEIWRRYGPSENLTISRLWASNEANEAAGHQVVIATGDKLQHRTDEEHYEWLKQAKCVIVDEAHRATSPMYTEVLEWLGISQRGRGQRTRCPLIGLTATPFRGTSVEETKRLVTRFGKKRLDEWSDEEEDPYTRFQRLGVLASVDGELLDGTSITLSPDEIKAFDDMGSMASDVFRRIESDADRNRRLLESIESKPDDWPILLFAVSIQHAHTLAALLKVRGIPAASIDGETNPTLRRRYIDEFRNGKIRVLCNYNVLTAGFDAPAVRAVYVTRPVFSPNAYQQMIGRGLRGPLNGGKERCLIVNVDDNWNMFGDQIAYTEFEHLWGHGELTNSSDAR